MPRSRSRRRKTNHYGQGFLSKVERQHIYGTGSKRYVHRSGYMGSRITSENRREYMDRQEGAYKDRHRANIHAQLQKIKGQDDKTEEQIAQEVGVFEQGQLTPEELDQAAKDFAKFQVGKERKHYKAWLDGKTVFRYRGQSHPVMSEAFLMASKSLEEIKNG